MKPDLFDPYENYVRIHPTTYRWINNRKTSQMSMKVSIKKRLYLTEHVQLQLYLMLQALLKFAALQVQFSKSEEDKHELPVR